MITIFICLALIGAGLVPMLSVQFTPSPSTSSIQIYYSWPNASAKVLEQEVTSRLEGMFNAMKGVESISSTSTKGSGSIRVTLKRNVNPDAARFEIANLVRRIYPELPEGVSFPYLSMNIASENTSPVLSYSINSHESPYFIKRYVDRYLVAEFATMDGVGRVNVYGAEPYEWVISYDANLLFQLGIPVDQVISSIKTYLGKKELGKGNLVTAGSDFAKQISVNLFYRPKEEIDWQNIPVGKVEERIIRLADIGQARFQEAEVQAYYRVNGKNNLTMTLYPENGVNTLRLGEAIKEKMEEVRLDIPSQYQVKLVNDRVEPLSQELQKIKLRSLFSLLILLALTTIVYRNLKYLLVLFLSIAINLLIAVILFYLLEVELQLYSFAGITISFGIIIDNTIIMIDHLSKQKNRKAFLAILAASLTTIGAVMVIFLLEKSQRVNLEDFAIVIAINLGVSLLVAYYFVPALLEKFNLGHWRDRFSVKRKRRVVWSTRVYYRILLSFTKPFLKWILLLAVLVGFGLPLHLAPGEMEGGGIWASVYNKTLGSELFRQEIRPVLEPYLGGTLKLFTDNVYETSYYAEPSRTSLRVTGTMPEGSTIKQHNQAVQKLEHYISSFEEVRLYETSINSNNFSVINIYFTEESENNSFPFILKTLLEAKVNSLGGMDWTISGVGRGFSNALGSNTGRQRIELQGYNYDLLYEYAELLRMKLMEESNGRVKEVDIGAGGYRNASPFEFYLEFDPELMAFANVGPRLFYDELRNKLYSGMIANVVQESEAQDVKLVSDQHDKLHVWDLQNAPWIIGLQQFKLDQLAEITRRKTGNPIVKENQNYHLVLSYDFIGPGPLGNRFKDKMTEELKNIMPVGYSIAEASYARWDKGEKKNYLYILVVVGIIFFICAILLESLLQPLAIIAMIPISFIGTFLTFYLFGFNFDQGGYASLILLCGISVNAALYIINDVNNLKKASPCRDTLRIYLKAFNKKVTPILITIFSTLAGLIPFVWAGQRETFWFSFAVGSIGGVIFSLIGILVYLPLFINWRYKVDHPVEGKSLGK